MTEAKEPRGTLALRSLAMPADTNPAGDIFGGWLLSQMDIAGNLVAKKVAGGRTVTIAVDAMEFHLPVFVGDVVCCYTEVEKVGRTSIAIHIEVWVARQYEEGRVKATEGKFTYVAVDENRRPKPIK